MLALQAPRICPQTPCHRKRTGACLMLSLFSLHAERVEHVFNVQQRLQAGRARIVLLAPLERTDSICLAEQFIQFNSPVRHMLLHLPISQMHITSHYVNSMCSCLAGVAYHAWFSRGMSERANGNQCKVGQRTCQLLLATIRSPSTCVLACADAIACMAIAHIV